MKATKAMTVLFQVLLCANAFANGVVAQEPPGNKQHRYLVERTFPPGALAGLNTETKKKVNANNASVGVRWLQSYANSDMTKTYCIYEGPNEAAIRSAASLNKLPIDSIIEVPIDLDSGTRANPEQSPAPEIVTKKR